MTCAHTFHALNVRESTVGHDPIGPDRAIADALDDLLTDDRDRDGRVILAYAPEVRLRSDFRVRLAKLQAGLIPAQPPDLVPILAQMFLGFGASRASESDAQTHVAQYVTVLAHLPLWAVQGACRRFASGNVTIAECPDWKRAYAPSTAQLCQLAEASVRDYWREELRINAALTGTPAYQPTKEERERVSEGFAELITKIRPTREQRSRSLQPIGASISPVLKQALREREDLDRIARDGFESGDRQRHPLTQPNERNRREIDGSERAPIQVCRDCDP
jgi:hypothetical protein